MPMSRKPRVPAESIGALLLAVLPPSLLLLDPKNQASPLFLDPYLYIGYYLNLPGHLASFPNHYISSRLPALLPGWLAHSLLPPVVASVVLRLLLAWTSLGSLYIALRPHGVRAALLTCVILAGSPFFLVALGTDYTDAYAIAFLLMSFAAFQLGAASKTEGRRWYMLAGAALASLTFTNLFFVLFAALSGLYGLSLLRDSQKSLGRSLASLVAGFVLATLGFAGLNAALGGPWLFFASSVTAGVDLARTHDPYFHNGWNWLYRASWLALPVGTAVGSTAALVIRRWAPRSAVAPVGILGFGLATLLVLAPLNLGVVRYWYYVTPLLPFVAIVVGAMIAEPCQRMSGLVYLGLLTLASCVSLGLAICPSQYAVWPADGILRAIVPSVIIALAFLSFLATKSAGMAMVAFLLTLGAGHALSRLGYRYEAPWPQVPAVIYDRIRQHDPDRLDVLRAVVETARLLRSFDQPARIPLWYSFDEPLGTVFKAVACTHFLYVVNEQFPATGSSILDGVPMPNRPRWIAIVSEDPGAGMRGQSALADFGVATRPRMREEIVEGRIRFFLTLLERVD